MDFGWIFGGFLMDFGLILAGFLVGFPSIFGEVSGRCFARFLIKFSAIFWSLGSIFGRLLQRGGGHRSFAALWIWLE